MSDTNSVRPLGRLLKLPEVMVKTGLARSTVYRYLSLKDFPEPIRFSEACVRWPEADVDAWIRSKINAQ